MITNQSSNQENNFQKPCCAIGAFGTILMCSHTSILLCCCLNMQSNPFIFWTGVGLTTIGSSFGCIPVIYRGFINEESSQIDHINDNNTDIASEISIQDIVSEIDTQDIEDIYIELEIA